MPLIQVTSGGQRSLLKKKLQVCESQKSCLFVGDQILILPRNLPINSLKILQCDFLDFFFLILSLIVEVYLWWKLQASLVFLSGRTCTIGGWLNTFLPHCTWTAPGASEALSSSLSVLRRSAEREGCLQAEVGPLDSGCHRLGVPISRWAVPHGGEGSLHTECCLLLCVGARRLSGRHL